MKFCIANVAYFQEHGFNIEDWKKSIDSTKVIVHEERVIGLIPNIESDSNVQIYNYPSSELDLVLNSSEWSIE